MKAIVVKVNIITERKFTNLKPLIINECDVRNYLIRIPEQGKDKIPVTTTKEAEQALLKALKAVYHIKKVIWIDTKEMNDSRYIDVPTA